MDNLTINKTPEKLVVDFFSRVWGGSHDLGAIDEMMTEDYVIITGGKEIKGRHNFKNWVSQFQQLLLNALTISQEAFANAAGTRVVSRWICSGNNNGIFGLPADGRYVSFTGIAIWEIKNGKLATCWVERSALELYKELTTK
ncbi:MAG: ester cyclase [Chitinophagales bacterium]|nr:ester cyclase [Chitinophagales bacterium]